MPVTIDPRRVDAVLFYPGAVVTAEAGTLIRQLQDCGLGIAVVAANGTTAPDVGHVLCAATLTEATDHLAVRSGRCAVVATDRAGVAAGREGGFALVIGLTIDGDGAALRSDGADTVVGTLGEITVRTGDRRMSQLRDALQALGEADGDPGHLSVHQPAVFFDFDGTLSDIVEDPAAAKPAAGATEALRELAAQCPVAILSGRDLADVTERVGLPGIWYAGSHGFELTAPDGTHHQNEAAAETIALLEQVAGVLRDQLGPVAGVAVEHKRFGVAVHYRNVARDRVGEVAAAVRSAGQRDGLRVTTGREVIELRPDIDWDKGKTLRWVIDHLHEAGSGALTPIYLGDDITDEDAFDAVRDDGIPIVVKHTDDGDRATAAMFALDSPEAVSAFAERLARRLGNDARDAS